jgi:hypothetical protein
VRNAQQLRFSREPHGGCDEHVAYAGPGLRCHTKIEAGLSGNAYLMVRSDSDGLLEQCIPGHSTKTLCEGVGRVPLAIAAQDSANTKTSTLPPAVCTCTLGCLTLQVQSFTTGAEDSYEIC